MQKDSTGRPIDAADRHGCNARKFLGNLPGEQNGKGMSQYGDGTHFYSSRHHQILWDFMNSYVACSLALAASVAAGFCVERAFIKWSHREMVRRHGADWNSANDQQPAA
ncbi:hypothetical protein [Bradyrhizobium sp. 138]|uniref:hypothetical protein n=1 Tax=Bradyrhizobium sp. 138 TaxID=2782615 RepID=UPI001FFA9E49|nr:hypothetical protein [Bradyrhizobium sp. 138]